MSGREERPSAALFHAVRRQAPRIRRPLGCLEKSEDGRRDISCTILIQAPSGSTAQFHDRMPAIVEEQDFWAEGDSRKSCNLHRRICCKNGRFEALQQSAEG
jgi:putative SOS response-associated peptidase YedK